MNRRTEYYRGLTGIISVSVRELRIVVERYLQAAGLPDGVVFPIRDVLVDAEIGGLHALETLDRAFVGLGEAPRPRIANQSGSVAVDGRGAPAFLIAPDILDLAVVATREGEVGRVLIEHVSHAELLGALTVSAHLYGVELLVRLDSGREWKSRGPDLEPLVWEYPESAGTTPLAEVLCRLVDSPDSSEARVHRAGGAAMLRALENGFNVSAELWWRLWDGANQALTPDSLQSRSHAGASVYDEAGTLLGELGEEWDDGYTADGVSALDGALARSEIRRTAAEVSHGSSVSSAGRR